MQCLHHVYIYIYISTRNMQTYIIYIYIHVYVYIVDRQMGMGPVDFHGQETRLPDRGVWVSKQEVSRVGFDPLPCIALPGRGTWGSTPPPLLAGDMMGCALKHLAMYP